MRIHTNRLVTQDFADALASEQAAGRIALSVYFEKLSKHRSQSHDYAFEIQLRADRRLPGEGRRRPNTGASYQTPCPKDARCGRTAGHHGSCDWASGEYAATYDEWGWLMAALYELDPKAVWGTVKFPQYADREDFDQKTALTYHPQALLDALETGTSGFQVDPETKAMTFDPYPWVGRQEIGRQGANRHAVKRPGDRWYPRTVGYAHQNTREGSHV